MMKVTGKVGMIDKAQASEPKGSGPRVKRDAPAAARGGSEVGGERKADMKGALGGNPTDGNPLRGATKELHDQHPHHYSDHGPHHGGTEHIRHQPLHGMTPSKGYGR